MKKLFFLPVFLIAMLYAVGTKAQCSNSGSYANCHVTYYGVTYSYIYEWDYWTITPNTTINYSVHFGGANGNAYIYTDYDEESYYSSEGSSHYGSLNNGSYGYLELFVGMDAYSGGHIEINAYW